MVRFVGLVGLQMLFWQVEVSVERLKEGEDTLQQIQHCAVGGTLKVWRAGRSAVGERKQ